MPKKKAAKKKTVKKPTVLVGDRIRDKFRSLRPGEDDDVTTGLVTGIAGDVLIIDWDFPDAHRSNEINVQLVEVVD